MEKDNKIREKYKAPPIQPWNVNVFNKTSAIVKTKVIEEDIEGETKQIAIENFYKRFHDLEKIYGEGFVRGEIRSMLHCKDVNGNIIKWIIKTEFYCHIPREKRKEEKEETR